jgi:poly-beta-1,6-N-acetyl-D-glucosamine synthase
MLFTIIIIFIFSGYTLMVVYLIGGWLKSNSIERRSHNPSTLFSIIVPFRDEEDAIAQCIDSLSQLDYPKNLFEVLLVNDHSEDTSVSIISERIESLSNFRLMELTGKTGKKAALEFGISKSIHSVITTTDADCTFNTKWLSDLAAFMEETNANMIIAPVLFKHHTLFSKIQALDFLSLTGTMIATHLLEKKILSNGANLTFKKSSFNEVDGYKNIDSIPTGDDILLMQKFNEVFSDKVRLLKTTGSAVYTNPSSKLSPFIHQRIRWASKIGSHQNTFSKILGIIVFLTNCSLLLLLLLTALKLMFVEFFIVTFIVKCIIDFLFLFLIARSFKEKRLLWLIIITELFNMFIIPIVTIASLFKGYTWKGREY